MGCWRFYFDPIDFSKIRGFNGKRISIKFYFFSWFWNLSHTLNDKPSNRIAIAFGGLKLLAVLIEDFLHVDQRHLALHDEGVII